MWPGIFEIQYEKKANESHMTQEPDHQFQVGGRYENRKGVFEVLSMDGPNMTFRWDTGKEMTSSIELQAKIFRNIERERIAAITKKGYRAPKSSGELFTGLHPEDFSDDVTGTHWRAREQLGGAVTRMLDVREPFDSWSIYNRPEVHWASVTRYRLVHASLQAKYLVCVNPAEMCFGFYVERSNNCTDNQDDWIRFLSWAGAPENCRWLHQMVRSTGASLSHPYQDYPDLAFYGSVKALDDGSFYHDGEKPIKFAAIELAEFLNSLPQDLWLNLLIGRTISRDDAIVQSARIASTIAEFFNLLSPIYENKHPKDA